MSVPEGGDGPYRRLLLSSDPEVQDRIREDLKGDVDRHLTILRAWVQNPFLRLHDEEIEYALKTLDRVTSSLIYAREKAPGISAPKYVVFCMPKSGSSFVTAAIQHALDLPKAGLTSVAAPVLTSYFGMNSREQELDEFAIVKAIIGFPGGFVAQHHTRYSQYLALQAKFYGLKPMVTFRNILDCIVSFDDMMLTSRAAHAPTPWHADPPFALPRTYHYQPDEARYELLAHSYGVWLINFYLSWKRCAEQALISPLVINYETDILDREQFVSKVSAALEMTGEQRERLSRYAARPDRDKSRLNVGRKGRGMERVPTGARSFLAGYIRQFRDEITDDEAQYLVGS